MQPTWYSAIANPQSASELELSAILLAVEDLIMVFDRDGRCLKILSGNQNLLCKQASEQIGQTVYDILTPDLANRYLQAIQQTLTTQQTSNLEYCLGTIDGRETWFSAKVSPLSADTVVMVARDVTALKQREAELQSFFNGMPDVTLIFDHQGVCLKVLAPVNDELFVVPPTDIVGTTIQDTLPPAQAALQMHHIQQCIATQKTIINIEYSLPLRDAEVWFVASVAPLPGDRVIFISRDCSDRKRAEIALQASLDQLAAANHEITLLNQQLRSENLRMSAELAVTRQLQQMVLPQEQELQQIPGLDIASFMQPAEEVGGDYYDVLHHNGQVKIGIGDVTGHGLESGVLMLMTQTAVRTLLQHQETDSTRFLTTLNRVIYDNLQRMNCQKNLTLALLDYEAGQMRLSGQHEELLVVRREGQVERINTCGLGFPLGVVMEIEAFIDHTEFHLHSGDGVVLYTDGITECRNRDRQQYGLQRLCQTVSQHWQQSAAGVRQAVIDDVQQHIGDQKILDDLTLLILKQK